jgi:hypothetical protein
MTFKNREHAVSPNVFGSRAMATAGPRVIYAGAAIARKISVIGNRPVRKQVKRSTASVTDRCECGSSGPFGQYPEDSRHEVHNGRPRRPGFGFKR